MVVLDGLDAKRLRNLYVLNFINTASSYYNKYIQQKIKFDDGMFYPGYLWDCTLSPQIVSEEDALKIVQDKEKMYIMWDDHSCQRCVMTKEWNYSKQDILLIDKWACVNRLNMPEDMYVFDDTFSWSIVITHETNTKNETYCLYLKGRGQVGQGDRSPVSSEKE